MRLKDKGVLITGGASGIGRGMAMALAKEGAKIAIADMDAKAGAQTLEELRQFSPEAIFIEANLRETDKLASLVEKTVAAFGKLDVLINNAHASRQKTFIKNRREYSYLKEREGRSPVSRWEMNRQGVAYLLSRLSDCSSAICNR